jgi:hypothetical protein
MHDGAFKKRQAGTAGTSRKFKNETDYYQSLIYKIIFYSAQVLHLGNIKRQPYPPPIAPLALGLPLLMAVKLPLIQLHFYGCVRGSWTF